MFVLFQLTSSCISQTSIVNIFRFFKPSIGGKIHADFSDVNVIAVVSLSPDGEVSEQIKVNVPALETSLIVSLL